MLVVACTSPCQPSTVLGLSDFGLPVPDIALCILPGVSISFGLEEFYRRFSSTQISVLNFSISASWAYTPAVFVGFHAKVVRQPCHLLVVTSYNLLFVLLHSVTLCGSACFRHSSLSSFMISFGASPCDAGFADMENLEQHHGRLIKCVKGLLYFDSGWWAGIYCCDA
ncbi:hypothetical protein TNCT_94901 [Trichonephila clavata]|uniref:Uncharacterized protein n=1 Tax=Trichonephila clavata TaxID=2740835 RepID=A0A8X6KPL8_TRICU|nr:hypothetical protein TNCT_94901 [Trichonephila clavata]